MTLIVIEGVDGCGKETQIELLKQKLENIDVFKYPTQNYPLLNDYLEKKVEFDPKALFLLFLSDISNEQQKVKQALDQGKTVILDRYMYSTIAYEVNGGMSYEQGKEIIQSIGYLQPDKVLILDISSEISQQRKSKQKELDRYEENKNYLEKVRNNFLKLYEESFHAKEWIKIDASKTVEEVHNDILEALGQKK